MRTIITIPTAIAVVTVEIGIIRAESLIIGTTMHFDKRMQDTDKQKSNAKKKLFRKWKKFFIRVRISISQL